MGIERPGSLMPAARRRAAAHPPRRRRRHAPQGERGKFENLNALLAAHPPAAYDWLLVLDDDVALPRGFLDAFLCVAERTGLKLAQPAHRLHSHAAWPVTRRHPGATVRETTFVEIGPVTAFHRDTFDALLPFPTACGWAGASTSTGPRSPREHGWPIGDRRRHARSATRSAGGAAATPATAAIAEARAFLAAART